MQDFENTGDEAHQLEALERSRMQAAELTRRLRRRVRLFGLLLLLLIAVTGILAFTLLANEEDARPLMNLPRIAGVAAALAFATILVTAMLRYLEPATSRSLHRQVIRDLLERQRRLKQIVELSDEQREILAHRIEKSLEASGAERLIQKFESSLEERVKFDVLAHHHHAITTRLLREVQDLARRGNLNLALGMLTTLAGLGVLGQSVFSAPSQAAPAELVAFFIPRLSLVLLIELFAFFFLRLYKESLGGIKYFQNELTNVESKKIALLAAMQSKDVEAQKGVIATLAGTERNGVLLQGQTTVDLERDRLQFAGAGSLLKEVRQFLRSTKEERE